MVFIQKIDLKSYLAQLILVSLFLPVQVFASQSCQQYFELDLYFKDYSQILNEIEDHFMNHPSLIFQSQFPQPDIHNSGEFYSSNEWTWFKGHLEKQPSDVTIGFATNSAWDIAIRNNSKVLILADWSIRPLLFQEYLLRPLILLSHSKDEFFNLLSGVRSGSSESVIKASVQEFLETLKLDSRFSSLHLAVVATYFRIKLENLRPTFWDTEIINQLVFLHTAFQQRYYKQNLIRRGASLNIISQPLVTSFSSEESFLKLQELFESGIYYARTEFDNSEFYLEVVERYPSKSYALSISNIIDANYETLEFPQLAEIELLKFLNITFKILNPTHTLHFYQTRGVFGVFNYQFQKIKSQADLSEIKPVSNPDEDE